MNQGTNEAKTAETCLHLLRQASAAPTQKEAEAQLDQARRKFQQLQKTWSNSEFIPEIAEAGKLAREEITARWEKESNRPAEPTEAEALLNRGLELLEQAESDHSPEQAQANRAVGAARSIIRVLREIPGAENEVAQLAKAGAGARNRMEARQAESQLRQSAGNEKSPAPTPAGQNDEYDTLYCTECNAPIIAPEESEVAAEGWDPSRCLKHQPW